jgi:hypothetical protein
MARDTKLEWHRGINQALGEGGVNKARVWRSTCKDFYNKDYFTIVFPLKLIYKDRKGWSYVIFHGDTTTFDSLELPHAKDYKEAMKMAEDELMRINRP